MSKKNNKKIKNVNLKSNNNTNTNTVDKKNKSNNKEKILKNSFDVTNADSSLNINSQNDSESAKKENQNKKLNNNESTSNSVKNLSDNELKFDKNNEIKKNKNDKENLKEINSFSFQGFFKTYRIPLLSTIFDFISGMKSDTGLTKKNWIRLSISIFLILLGIGLIITSVFWIKGFFGFDNSNSDLNNWGSGIVLAIGTICILFS